MDKSNIKFLEYAMLGLPIIVSDHPIYQSIARHNHNCLVVKNTSEDWLNAIKLLSYDKTLRDRISIQAYEDILRDYSYIEGKQELLQNVKALLKLDLTIIHILKIKIAVIYCIVIYN